MVKFNSLSIVYLMERDSLSLSDMARKIGNGATRQLVFNWVKKGQTPETRYLVLIADAFGIGMEFFFAETYPPMDNKEAV